MSDPYNSGGRSSRRPVREITANTDEQKRHAARILERAPPLMLVEDIENTGARLAIAALAGQRFTYKGTDK